MRKLIATTLVFFVAVAAAHTSASVDSGWTPLFNGKNFDGWYSYLPSSGRNSDPKRVFKVEHGMIHILDIPETREFQEFGYLATEKEFEHCRIRAEYKWGTKRFVPRADDKRDSGLLYYFVGPDKVWPRSLELQIQETDTGDLWITDGPSVATSLDDQERLPIYAAGLHPHRQNSGRIIKSADFEDRRDWNTVEAVLDGDRITHLVNGHVVMRAWNLKQPDPHSPEKMITLDRGRILLQAEGSEVWFRNVRMQPLPPISPRTASAGGSTPLLSIDAPFSLVVSDPRARNLLKILLGDDLLANPWLERVTPDSTVRDVVIAAMSVSDDQLTALDSALRTLPSHQ